MVTVFEVPDGASFTEVTLTVIVLALGSRLVPPLAVPALSWTWTSKVSVPEATDVVALDSCELRTAKVPPPITPVTGTIQPGRGLD